ncbi:hypothetical protein LTR85_011128 [Meristemomyces frigidus]|nr:hypothetical protein LTR85_011128 [Meristemomyces frigidus]
MAILASDEAMPELFRSYRAQQNRVLIHGVDSTAFLWALRQIALDIPLPVAMQIPITQDPPLPFAKSFTFNQWYAQHNDRLSSTADYLTEGSWCGYYTLLGPNIEHVDPPMTNIKFHLIPTPHSPPDELSLKAEGCRDGAGSFTITGAFRKHPEATDAQNDRLKSRGDEIAFTAVKQYTNSGTSWQWDLRITPFGLVGFWGLLGGSDRGRGSTWLVTLGMERYGVVWLWKEEWTAVA